MVYNTVLGYLQNAEDAEEVTQDVFIEIHQSLHKFKAESSLKTWIYRIAINKSIDFLKYSKRKKRFGMMTSIFIGTSLEPAHITPNFFHPGVALEQKEQSAILFKAINSLPESQKTAFILAKVEGLSNVEIAEIISKSVGSVESLLSRAKENLKIKLEDYYKK